MCKYIPMEDRLSSNIRYTAKVKDRSGKTVKYYNISDILIEKLEEIGLEITYKRKYDEMRDKLEQDTKLINDERIGRFKNVRQHN